MGHSRKVGYGGQEEWLVFCIIGFRVCQLKWWTWRNWGRVFGVICKDSLWDTGRSYQGDWEWPGWGWAWNWAWYVTLLCCDHFLLLIFALFTVSKMNFDDNKWFDLCLWTSVDGERCPGTCGPWKGSAGMPQKATLPESRSYL